MLADYMLADYTIVNYRVTITLKKLDAIIQHAIS